MARVRLPGAAALTPRQQSGSFGTLRFDATFLCRFQADFAQETRHRAPARRWLTSCPGTVASVPLRDWSDPRPAGRLSAPPNMAPRPVPAAEGTPGCPTATASSAPCTGSAVPRVVFSVTACDRGAIWTPPLSTSPEHTRRRNRVIISLVTGPPRDVTQAGSGGPGTSELDEVRFSAHCPRHPHRRLKLLSGLNLGGVPGI